MPIVTISLFVETEPMYALLPLAGDKTMFALPVTVKSPDPATSISDTEIVPFNVNSFAVTVKLESTD